MARVVIDTHPIRSLKGDAAIKGSVYESLLEARGNFIFLRFIGHSKFEHNLRLIDEWVDYLVPQLEQSADAFIFCHTPDTMDSP